MGNRGCQRLVSATTARYAAAEVSFVVDDAEVSLSLEDLLSFASVLAGLVSSVFLLSELGAPFLP